jgi:pyruvate/2-oxoglutarate dehydrogenase complex dihydrolipoamide acyltransferase (E2) component
MSENPKTIKVVDRRLFTADGDVRDDVQAELASPEAPAEAPQAAAEPAPAPAEAATPTSPAFLALLDMLAQTGLVYLEGVPDASGRRAPNVAGARQIVDALLALRDKTRGKLSFEETDALEGILGELQLVFTRLAAGARPKGPVPPPAARRG